jgi:hypothetical protein
VKLALAPRPEQRGASRGPTPEVNAPSLLRVWGSGERDRPEAARPPGGCAAAGAAGGFNAVQKLLTNRDLNDLNAEAGLAIAAAINEMVEAATSADAKPAGSTKTSPDDDDEAGAGAVARLGNGTVMARQLISDAVGRCLRIEEGARSASTATLFACGAGDGNRTRTVSLGS